MKSYKLSDMVGGWFVGNFSPTALKTEFFEAGTKIHKCGEKWDVHTHKKSIEITLVVSGKMKIQDKIFESGDIFVLEPWEIADPTFEQDTMVFVLKTPSYTQDKFVLEMK